MPELGLGIIAKLGGAVADGRGVSLGLRGENWGVVSGSSESSFNDLLEGYRPII